MHTILVFESRDVDPNKSNESWIGAETHPLAGDPFLVV